MKSFSYTLYIEFNIDRMEYGYIFFQACIVASAVFLYVEYLKKNYSFECIERRLHERMEQKLKNKISQFRKKYASQIRHEMLSSMRDIHERIDQIEKKLSDGNVFVRG